MTQLRNNLSKIDLVAYFKEHQLFSFISFAFLLIVLVITVSLVNIQTRLQSEARFISNQGIIKAASFDRAIKFPDHSGYVVVQNSHLLTGFSAVTLEAWVNFTPYETYDEQTIISKSFDPPRVFVPYSFQLENDGHLYFLYAIWDGDSWHSTAITSTGVVTPGAWHHVAVTYDSEKIRLFADGKLIGERAHTGKIGGNDDNKPGFNVKVGVDCYSSTLGNCRENIFNYFNGLIDEVRISNTARYTSDFKPATSPFNPDANTLLLYHFDQSSGDTIQDLSGKGYQGKAFGNYQFVTSILPSPSPSPSPTPSPTPKPSPSPTPSPTPEPTLEPQPSSTPLPLPVNCQEECVSQGHQTGFCSRVPIYKNLTPCSNSSLLTDIGQTQDCYVAPGVVGLNKSCCCLY